MKLNALAAKTGFTSSYLSQLERNLIDPSIASLRKIALALDVPIHALLSSLERHHVVVKSDKRIKLSLPDTRIEYEYLSPMASNDEVRPKFEMFHFTLEPNTSHSKEPSEHKSDECIFVVEGTLKVTLDTEDVVLEKGDSIYIQESMPHHFHNPTDTMTVCISSLSKPI